MRKSKKRVQKQPDQREQIGALLLALNTKIPPQSEAAIRALRRVVPNAGTLARIVLRLQRLVNDTPKEWLSFYPEYPAARHLFLLNQQLAAYTTFPFITTDGKGGWSFGWEVQAGGPGDFRRSEELPLVLTAIRLAEQGLIDLVRRCPIDRRWFYARTQASRFCCSECREKFHRRDPVRKAERRKYMRELYWTHKTKNVK